MSLYGDLIPELKDDSGQNQEAKQTPDKSDASEIAAASADPTLIVQEISIQSSSNTSSDWSSSVLKFQPIKRKPTIVTKPIIKARHSSSIVSRLPNADADDVDELEAFSKDIESASSGTSASIAVLNEAATGTSIFKPPVRNPHYGIKEDTPQTQLTSSLEDVNGFQHIEHAKAVPRKRKAGKTGKKGQAKHATRDPEDVFSEEYDPAVPNDYEECKRMFKILKERHEEGSVYSDDDDVEPEDLDWKNRKNRFAPKSSSNLSGAGFKPLPAVPIDKKLSGDDAYAQRMALSKASEPSLNKVPLSTSPADIQARLQSVIASISQAVEAVTSATEASSPPRSRDPNFAKNIMTSYGWSEGQGLGRKGVGILNPLTAVRSDGKIGNIVNDNAMVEEDIESLGAISKLIVLTNMASAVDESVDEQELQQETGEECDNYGKVERCAVFRIPVPFGQRLGTEGQERGGEVLPEHLPLLRIFVVFADEGAATRAVQDLRGRYFGGRQIWARFWDVRKLRSGVFV